MPTEGKIPAYAIQPIHGRASGIASLLLALAYFGNNGICGLVRSRWKVHRAEVQLSINRLTTSNPVECIGHSLGEWPTSVHRQGGTWGTRLQAKCLSVYNIHYVAGLYFPQIKCSAASGLQSCRWNALADLIHRKIFLARRDVPSVAEWIDNVPVAVAVELVRDRHGYGCSRGNGLMKSLIYVLNI
jgi:hypothetical protein